MTSLTDATATNEALRAEIMSVNRELAQAEIRANYHANRVAIIEEERDAYKRDLDAELTGNAALRRDFGARDDETMCEFVARLARERDEAVSRSAELPAVKRERDRLMAGACAICATCEGPLTCATCVPVKPPGIALFDDPNIVRTVLDDLDDHEARIKVLAEQCDSLLGRIQLLEGKTRNLGGDGQWLVEGCPTLAGKMPPPGNTYLGCKRCGGAKKSFQVYCGAACAAQDGA